MSKQNNTGNKTTTWRNHLMRNLSTELIMREQLIITATRAKELKKHVEKLITLAKSGTLHDRRQALTYLRPAEGETNNVACQKLFDILAKKYSKRAGGYTKVLKVQNRGGDNAPMAIIQFV